MNTCDWCGKKTDFNTEIRVAPINPSDKLIWGRIKLCPECRTEVTASDIYEYVLERVKK